MKGFLFNFDGRKKFNFVVTKFSDYPFDYWENMGIIV